MGPFEDAAVASSVLPSSPPPPSLLRGWEWDPGRHSGSSSRGLRARDMARTTCRVCCVCVFGYYNTRGQLLRGLIIGRRRAICWLRLGRWFFPRSICGRVGLIASIDWCIDEPSWWLRRDPAQQQAAARLLRLLIANALAPPRLIRQRAPHSHTHSNRREGEGRRHPVHLLASRHATQQHRHHSTHTYMK